MKCTASEQEPLNITGDNHIYSYKVEPDLFIECIPDRYNRNDFSIRTVWSFLKDGKNIKQEQTYNCLLEKGDTSEVLYSQVDLIIEDSIERVNSNYNSDIQSSDYLEKINNFKKELLVIQSNQN